MNALYPVLFGCGGIIVLLAVGGLWIKIRDRRDDRRRLVEGDALLKSLWCPELEGVEWITISKLGALPRAFPHPNKMDCLYWIFVVFAGHGELMFIFQNRRCLTTPEMRRLIDESDEWAPSFEMQIKQKSKE